MIGDLISLFVHLLNEWIESIFTDGFIIGFFIGLLIFYVGLVILLLNLYQRIIGRKVEGSVIGGIKSSGILDAVFEYRDIDGKTYLGLSAYGGTGIKKYRTGERRKLIICSLAGNNVIHDAKRFLDIYASVCILAIGLVLMSLSAKLLASLEIGFLSILFAAIIIFIKYFLYRKKSKYLPIYHSSSVDKEQIRPIESF